MFGDPINNSKDLNTVQLSEISTLKAGKAIITGELINEPQQGYYPCYGGNGIRGFINRFSHEKNLPIIGRQGALAGNVKYGIGKFYATEHAVVATPIVDMNCVWYYYALKYLNLMRFQTGAAQPGLTVEILNKVTLAFPTIELQNKFAQIVEQIDKQKFEFEKSLNKLEELQASLMQEYFG